MTSTIQLHLSLMTTKPAMRLTMTTSGDAMKKLTPQEIKILFTVVTTLHLTLQMKSTTNSSLDFHKLKKNNHLRLQNLQVAGILKPFAIAFTTTYPTQKIIKNGWVPLKTREVVAHAQLFLRHRSLKHQLPRRKGIRTQRESQNRTLLTAQWILKRQESYSENNLVTIKGVKVEGCISTGSFRSNMVP